MVLASLDSLCDQRSKSPSKDAGTMTGVYLILGLVHRFSQVDETRHPREGGGWIAVKSWVPVWKMDSRLRGKDKVAETMNNA